MFLKEFVGKCLNSAYINDRKDLMYWQVEGVWYELAAIGDCCSYSWYEHCDNGSALQDSILTGFEDYNAESKSNDWNLIQINMLKFQTSKGYCTIEFRNESNGYYSGWCQVTELNVAPNLKDFKLVEDF